MSVCYVCQLPSFPGNVIRFENGKPDSAWRHDQCSPVSRPGCSCGGTCNTCRIIAQYAPKPKAPWRLLPMEAMPYVLDSLALGLDKHPGSDGWEQRADLEDWEASMRHLQQLRLGADLDEDGQHHAAAIANRMLFTLARYDRKKKTQP